MKAASQPPCTDVQILLEEGGSGGEVLWSSGAGHGASIALQTWSCPDASQLRQKTAAGKKKILQRNPLRLCALGLLGV